MYGVHIVGEYNKVCPLGCQASLIDIKPKKLEARKEPTVQKAGVAGNRTPDLIHAKDALYCASQD